MTESTAMTTVNPMALLQKAVESNADLEKLEKLMDLQEQWEQKQSRQAYIEAMAAFKANPPKLTKDSEVDYTHNGKRTNYRHASHDQVMSKIAEALSKHGLSHSFKINQENGLISVKCSVSHINGHSESVMLSAAPDASGGKNSIQAVGSTVTYLQRYTVLSITGLSAGEHDDDGRASEGISEDQAAEVREALKNYGKSEAQMLAWLGAESIEALTPDQYDRAMQKMAPRAAA